MEVRRDAARLEGGLRLPRAPHAVAVAGKMRRGALPDSVGVLLVRRRPARQFCRRRARHGARGAAARRRLLEAAAAADDGPAAAAPRAVRRARRLPAERVRDARRAPRRRAAERRAAVERARLPLRRRAELLRPRASRRVRLAPSAGAVLAFNDKGAHLYHTLLESLASAAPLLDRVRRGGDLRLLLNACLQKGDRRTTMTPPPPSGRCWPRCRSPAGARGGEAARTAAYRRPRRVRAAGRRGAGGRTRLLSWARVWAAAPALAGAAAPPTAFAGGGRLHLPNWLLLREELRRSSPHLFSGGGSGGGVRVLYIRREAWQGRQLVARKEARLRRLLATCRM